MKALLLDIDGKRNAILMLGDGNIIKKRLDRHHPYQVGQEIVIHGYSSSGRIFAMSKMKVALVSLLLLCLPLSYAQTVNAVYLDVNPSLRLDVNVYGRIIDATALNVDAEKILSTLPDLTNKTVAKGIGAVIHTLTEEGYLNAALPQRLYVSYVARVKALSPSAERMETIVEAALIANADTEQILIMKTYDQGNRLGWQKKSQSPLRYEIEETGRLETDNAVVTDEDTKEEIKGIREENKIKRFEEFDAFLEEKQLNKKDPNNDQNKGNNDNINKNKGPEEDSEDKDDDFEADEDSDSGNGENQNSNKNKNNKGN